MPRIRSPSSESSDGLEPLLAEQLAYYRALAPHYGETAFPDHDEGALRAAANELSGAIEGFRIAGDVLELACGPGTWTELLVTGATTLTAVDAAPEMLGIAGGRIDDERVRFVQADIFDWVPDRAYDCVFFGFWLSHVPVERFGPFWAMVAGALKPDGRVLFFDDAYRTAEELIEGPEASTIRRRLGDGTTYRVVKVPHAPAELETSLRRLGWDISVHPTRGPFYWGAGSRARPGRP
jgi:SAM-dependent methyltransferase